MDAVPSTEPVSLCLYFLERPLLFIFSAFRQSRMMGMLNVKILNSTKPVSLKHRNTLQTWFYVYLYWNSYSVISSTVDGELPFVSQNP